MLMLKQSANTAGSGLNPTRDPSVLVTMLQARVPLANVDLMGIEPITLDPEFSDETIKRLAAQSRRRRRPEQFTMQIEQEDGSVTSGQFRQAVDCEIGSIRPVWIATARYPTVVERVILKEANDQSLRTSLGHVISPRRTYVRLS